MKNVIRQKKCDGCNAAVCRADDLLNIKYAAMLQSGRYGLSEVCRREALWRLSKRIYAYDVLN